MKVKNTLKKMPIRLKITCISLACTLFGMLYLLLTNHFSNKATTSKLVMDKTHLIAKSIALSADVYLHSYSVILSMISDTLNIDTTAEASQYIKFFDTKIT